MSTGTIAREYDLRRVSASALDTLILRAGTCEPIAIYRPVVAVTLTRGAARDEVLIVVRDAHDNRTHPNVVSSPTRRIHGLDREVQGLAPHQVYVPGWLLTEVRALLVEKVGVPADVAAQLSGSTVQVWQGESIIAVEDARVIVEPLTMLNVHVALPAGIAVPARTAAHSQQRFVARLDHRDAFSRRDATGIADMDSDGVVPLVYGLCTQSTTAMLELLESSVSDPSRH